MPHALERCCSRHPTARAIPLKTGGERTGRFFERFAGSGSLGGILLLATSLLALIWANSPWHTTYSALLEQPLSVGVGDFSLKLTALAWLNEGLMALFFLLVGLELKRELLVGELASRGKAVLPVAAAVGGMAVPTVFYLALTPPGAESAGWAIPMATDIAFALGVLALLESRIPTGLKVFLTALAVVDDLGAVLVIALFYTGNLHLEALVLAGVFLGVLAWFNRLRVRSLVPYLVIGAAMWLALHESGLHATLAGIALALAVPTRTLIDAAQFSARARSLVNEFDAAETGDLQVLTSQGQQEALHQLEQSAERVQAPLLRLEHRLQPLVHYGILPVFAFANAGVRLVGSEAGTSPITLGVAAGLVLGKPVGITLAAWLAVRGGVAVLPLGTTWPMIHGAAWLGGIGFTVSLFVAALAFGSTPDHLFAAKLGILAGSTVAGITGGLLLRRAITLPHSPGYS